MKVVKDSVVMGNVPAGTDVGDGSVVVGATEAHGNTILNTPMAVGRNASAGSNSIAIGAGAIMPAGYPTLQPSSTNLSCWLNRAAMWLLLII